MANFVAIDFETSDNGRDAACSVALVVVRGGKVVDTVSRLIRPPRKRVRFTEIHGLTWEDLADAPDFAGVWPDLKDALAGADFLAAHNAAFDRRVLEGCCAAHGLSYPQKPYLCTVQLARDVWNVRPTRLPDVCRFLCLQLNHHDALSDAMACANIVLAAIEEGYDLRRNIPGYAHHRG
ncbi:MAG TPA: 3'-5' exonuclease [Magnetospirillum sp.]|nr:3'-5' exonuclease [Magnetospirillum sp.]